ncbi:MAG: inositol monophosphatase family protein [bacterium]
MTADYLDVAIKAVKTSGEILIDYFEKLHDFRQKNQNIRDLVTEVDILSEKNIKNIIKEAFPGHSIKAEESSIEKKDTTRIWHIDPIDGTVNYSQGIPICAISVALEENNEIVTGVIFNPFSDELYFSSKGHGAYLNGKQIHVSQKDNLKDGLYVAAFSSASSEEKKKEYEIFGRMNDSTRGVLRIGSAALALAYCAHGRIDGFWAKDLYSWDLAAGTVMVKEAGGMVFQSAQNILIASNASLHKALLQQLEGL